MTYIRFRINETEVLVLLEFNYVPLFYLAFRSAATVNINLQLGSKVGFVLLVVGLKKKGKQKLVLEKMTTKSCNNALTATISQTALTATISQTAL